ncbi:glucose-6-phosphate dehydrogenase assembly protein OpcA [Kocuria varians]|uniref:Glucose-6-phosphate dehydrogenase assembly protein OpcA n=1 Tax=Kocuria varians TaxID=1272 RepID=A0A4Y4D4F8_KOCVA|nr:glucose-6-phosphate dehydrogenase assembly protein OpcA [Kocuria varians]GEC98594.1 glucose-6-phosphate dehydrogenase assembly protein OpcA [Kocuria varians]
MIVQMEDTTAAKIEKKLNQLRHEGGVVTLGRVLTLVILAQAGHSESAVEAANYASHEHPCRIIVHVAHSRTDETRLDAQLRLGGDAGASEVIVLHGYGDLAEPTETLVSALLLPDAPIVAWWPHDFPANPSESSIGSIAHRRITDSSRAEDPFESLTQLSRQYTPGDTDLAWTRITNWRVQLAAVLDQVGPVTVQEIVLEGAAVAPSMLLFGVWLSQRLGAKVTVNSDDSHRALDRVALITDKGTVEIHRPGRTVAVVSQPGQPDQQIAMPVRDLKTCLAEELRRLGPDEVYGEVIRDGLHAAEVCTAAEDVARGAAADLAEEDVAEEVEDASEAVSQGRENDGVAAGSVGGAGSAPGSASDADGQAAR